MALAAEVELRQPKHFQQLLTQFMTRAPPEDEINEHLFYLY